MVSLQTEVPAKTKQERLYYLDWLRVLAVLGVFFFHTLRPFDTLGDWNIKNTDQSLVASLILGWGSEVGMPAAMMPERRVDLRCARAQAASFCASAACVCSFP